MFLSLLLVACTPDPEPEPATFPTPDTGPTIPVDPLQFDGDPPTNVLMISIDTFRKDHLDLYGDHETSPFLTRLATEGVHLDDHVQCSNWTWHSTSCTLAGRYDVDVGHIPNLVGMHEPLPDVRTLAHVLADDRGYQTVLLSKNAWLGPQWNNAQGYKVVNPPNDPGTYNLVMGAMANRAPVGEDPNQQPWLVHVHLLEPHAPYNGPQDLRWGIEDLPPLPEGIDLDNQDAHYSALNDLRDLTEEEVETVLAHMRIRYAAEIRWLDIQLEQAFAELDAAGELDDTLVVVWTDHGEAFFEHGVQTHAHNLYGEENDAILFLWAKNLAPAAYAGPTHAVDLVPTVLSILDVPLDDDLAGHPLDEAPDDRIRFSSVVARQGVQLAAMKDEHKLLYEVRFDRWSLYDRSTDPDETVNLLDALPDHPMLGVLQPALSARIEAYAELMAKQQGIIAP